MQKIFIITCLVLCLVGSAFGQQHHTVSVTFVKDGKKVKLKDDFKVYLVLEDSLKTTVIKPKIENNRFVIPDFQKGQKGMVIFKYKKILIGFNQRVDMQRNVAYDFGVDYKPFDSKFTNGQKLKGVKCIVYLSWPYSESRVRMELKHPKKYRRRILKLIK